MSNKTDFTKRIRKSFVENESKSIIYHYDDGLLEINWQGYKVGKFSFSEVANAVLGRLKNLNCDYKTIPYSFNSEAYENELFEAAP
ncbi:hypothetical protein KJA13_03040 [Patescibacteria group bacterium]|nr:hypothetical protein [Patescibacteria group bacterium]